MTLDLAAVVPPSLSPACAAMTIGDAPGCTRADRLGGTGAFDRALHAFAAGYVEPDRAALVSFWSMYYLAALIAPASTPAGSPRSASPMPGLREPRMAVASISWSKATSRPS